MNDFFGSFVDYCKQAEYSSLVFWAFPTCTVLFIWILTATGPKIFSTRRKLKTVFIIFRTWIGSALITAALIIGMICYLWATNYFNSYHFELSLLISLFIAMLIPIIAIVRLRKQFSSEGIKEITDQPKTPYQFDSVISFLRRAFRKNKWFYLAPVAGFSMLLFILNSGTNLISIVLDNTYSQSGVFDNIKTSLNETIAQLNNNNKVVITTFTGTGTKQSFGEIEKVKVYNPSADVSAFFNTIPEATSYVSTLSSLKDVGSPITEVVWQNFLYAKDREPGETGGFKNKILLVITDGDENGLKQIGNRFLCNADDFNSFFLNENIHVIDYSTQQNFAFTQSAKNCGYDIQDGSNKENYSYALSQVLNNYQTSWFLIFWAILIFSIMALIGLSIEPKKIV